MRLILVDTAKANEAKLKALGSKGNVKLGENGYRVILGPEAEFVADAMKKLIIPLEYRSKRSEYCNFLQKTTAC